MDDSWSIDVGNQKIKSIPEPKNSLVSLTYHQQNLVESTKAERFTLYSIFTTFGSLLALTIRFTLLLISHIQGFSLSNSLIKKLYSANETKPSDAGNDGYSGPGQDSGTLGNEDNAAMQ
mmetsp:Transcript_6753/g.9228  ORF Transcript_6753/g.9228 Transcript_6753/m.9228 type:complete len:119 (+) Transcript_6753:137-493(+)